MDLPWLGHLQYKTLTPLKKIPTISPDTSCGKQALTREHACCEIYNHVTTVRLIKNCLVILMAALLTCVPYAVKAYECGPSENTDIYFEKNSAIVSANQLSKLKKWADALRAKYPGDKIITLASNVEVGEMGEQQLGRQRELAVRLALIDFDFSTPNMVVMEKIPVHMADRPGSIYVEDLKRVEINFTPGCPELQRFIEK